MLNSVQLQASLLNEDTDVILCLRYCKKIKCPLYQKSGTLNQKRYINFTTLLSSLEMTSSMGCFGVHALTGCDRVSGFAGQGKLSALKLVKRNGTGQRKV